ncbi:beta-galactosidase bgaB [mine drainage metagenome]|uniref:beta-galactosidase n=1 Tax=mine drainage metagenome TaxID=410659 RepID=A0A1J5RYY1_9ZZZZ
MIKLYNTMKQTILKIIVLGLFFTGWAVASNAQHLYVGANYHPHDDKNIEKIKEDIRLMKAAGLNVVRMGHLAWDSYETSEGKFDFAWFDKVMNLMNDAGIKVILDIALHPAPIWLHKKFPSIDVVDASGNKLYPNHRYMDDVGDPGYQKYALRYADSISNHYKNYPALLAFGIDNESGDGPISYSETVKQRFVVWLKKKYSNLENLNTAWASQRWSRRINGWDEIGLPQSGNVAGAPERVLDFRRFISDEINNLLLKVLDKVNTNAPNVLTNTNSWFFSPMKYFDWSEIAYSGKLKREGEGFYPGNTLITNWGIMNSLFGISRIQFESKEPFWCSEFTTMNAVPNSIRKSAYATLFYGNQMVCGWTWQSMHAGEEQFLEGMLDWDGIPNRKYDEYKKIATEFKKIEKYFPYKPKPEAALAFSFPSVIAGGEFTEKQDEQLQTCWNLFYQRNMDANVAEISKSNLKYKLLFVPGVSVMDKTTATKIRDFVAGGGTVVMTGNSAVMDEHGQVFKTIRPGLLNDVFGIRVASYEETESLNELSRKAFSGKKIEINYNGKNINLETPRFDVIETKGAETLANITSLDKDYPIVTTHNYGKGTAIFVGVSANESLLNPLLDDLINELKIKKGPDVPSGIMARQIDENHFLYLNATGETKQIKLKGKLRSILSDKNYEDGFSIDPYEPEFIEVK